VLKSVELALGVLVVLLLCNKLLVNFIDHVH
jgi:hypothetical protein